ncbi:hypothetical protein BKA70DRAFT_1326936 [Coprinopsis sp. MPI-PUGE-AT-0042]|nr:hypothetical protein BKA70DRAFT_1326936 [Coprinopsis sp. MPI-PUGE-AT-0042]
MSCTLGLSYQLWVLCWDDLSTMFVSFHLLRFQILTILRIERHCSFCFPFLSAFDLALILILLYSNP